MDNGRLKNSDLDRLIRNSIGAIPDSGFSSRVIKKIRRRQHLSTCMPFFFGLVGSIVSLAGASEDWVSALFLPLFRSVTVYASAQSRESLTLAPGFGLELSLVSLFLAFTLLLLSLAFLEE